MKHRPKPSKCLILVGALLALVFVAGCTSTKTEQGVTIEKQRSANPMSWF